MIPENWRKENLNEVARVIDCKHRTPKYVPEGVPVVSPGTIKWGSCSPKGNLMLNLHLVKAPKECIDYVILHELCHIAEHNHGDKFWRLLGQVMPHWKEVKVKLDGMADLYLNE